MQTTKPVQLVSRPVLRLAALILAVSVIGGCQTATDAMLSGMGALNSAPPNLSAAASRPSDDPELKIYQALIGSLDKGFQGSLGRTLSPAERAKFMAEREATAIAWTTNNGAGSIAPRAQILATVERELDNERASPPPAHLNPLPPGCLPDKSVAMVKSKPIMGTDEAQHAITEVSVLYQFASAQEMTAKANMLAGKLRGLFAGQTGWQILDLEQIRKTEQTTRALSAELAKASGESREHQAAREDALKSGADYTRSLFEAGMLMMSYAWPSGYYTHRGTGLGLSGIPAQSLVVISVSPNPVPLNQRYSLVVSISRHIVQPPNAPLATLAARES